MIVLNPVTRLALRVAEMVVHAIDKRIHKLEFCIMSKIDDVLAVLATIQTHQAAQSVALAQLQTDAQAAIALLTAAKASGGATDEQLDQVLAALTNIDGGVTTATSLQSSIDSTLANAVSPAPAPAPTPAPSPAPSETPPADSSSPAPAPAPEPTPAPAEPAPPAAA